MRGIIRMLRPTPALGVACLALFVALGGTGYAALKLKANSVKTRNIKDRAVTGPKLADGSIGSAKLAPGTVAPDAARLDGRPASDFQRLCTGGAIKATAVVDTTGAGAAFANVPGFNCFRPGNLSSSVQVERLAQGQYFVRFVGNSGPNASGSAVVTSVAGDGLVTYDIANPSPVPGENVFLVVVRNGAGNPVDNRKFSLLAF
jgi:hypothetical protein